MMTQQQLTHTQNNKQKTTKQQNKEVQQAKKKSVFIMPKLHTKRLLVMRRNGFYVWFLHNFSFPHCFGNFVFI
jgi:hypothetical protein